MTQQKTLGVTMTTANPTDPVAKLRSEAIWLDRQIGCDGCLPLPEPHCGHCEELSDCVETLRALATAWEAERARVAEVARRIDEVGGASFWANEVMRALEGGEAGGDPARGLTEQSGRIGGTDHNSGKQQPGGGDSLSSTTCAAELPPATPCTCGHRPDASHVQDGKTGEYKQCIDCGCPGYSPAKEDESDVK